MTWFGNPVVRMAAEKTGITVNLYRRGVATAGGSAENDWTLIAASVPAVVGTGAQTLDVASVFQNVRDVLNIITPYGADGTSFNLQAGDRCEIVGDATGISYLITSALAPVGIGDEWKFWSIEAVRKE